MAAITQTTPMSCRLDETRRRIERWRETRPHRQAPMPAALWDAAVSAARQHGLYPTVRTLRVDYGALKKHVEAANLSHAPAAPTFVELAPASPTTLTDPVACVVDVIGAGGSKRIRLTGLAPSDLMTLARMAWSEGQ